MCTACLLHPGSTCVPVLQCSINPTLCCCPACVLSAAGPAAPAVGLVCLGGFVDNNPAAHCVWDAGLCVGCAVGLSCACGALFCSKQGRPYERGCACINHPSVQGNSGGSAPFSQGFGRGGLLSPFNRCFQACLFGYCQPVWLSRFSVWV
jgi:hypothetical protein